MTAHRAPAFDPGDHAQHARVGSRAIYDVQIALWHRRVGNGTIYCRLLKASAGPARRLVELVAEFEDRGVGELRVVRCTSEADEHRELERLEGIMRAAAARPTPAPA